MQYSVSTFDISVHLDPYWCFIKLAKHGEKSHLNGTEISIDFRNSAHRISTSFFNSLMPVLCIVQSCINNVGQYLNDPSFL